MNKKLNSIFSISIRKILLLKKKNDIFNKHTLKLLKSMRRFFTKNDYI